MEAINTKQVQEMLIYVADKIIEQKSYLTEIDSKIGDGDHGIGMAGGMKKVKNKLEGQSFDNVYAVFETAGKAMMMSMGGASGIIFGSLYLAGAKGMTAQTTLVPVKMAELFRKSLTAIKERGKAQVGDKTMVDALEPAVIAMEANADQGILTMLKYAEEAAQKGVIETKQYVAKYGRAKSLMERAIGYQDPGATSVWLIVKSMREYIENAYQL